MRYLLRYVNYKIGLKEKMDDTIKMVYFKMIIPIRRLRDERWEKFIYISLRIHSKGNLVINKYQTDLYNIRNNDYGKT